MSFSPSPRQVAIAEKLFSPENLLIQACAGSGKTTTMVWLASMIPASLRVLALSFNKSIADELAKRMPSHVHSCTMHSIGFRMIRNAVRIVRLDDRKLMNIIDTHPGVVVHQNGIRAAIVSDLLAVVPLAQDTLVDAENTSLLAALAESAGRTLELPEKSLPLVASIIQASDAMKNYISFSEMIRHPVVHSYAPEFYDVVMVDEVQDLNSAQHALLHKLVRPGGKLIAVGDRFQSIYGFRGADPRSMERLKADWNMTELPLDVSYRCASSIVAEAQKIVGAETIVPRDGVSVGSVEVSTLDKLRTEAQEGDMILCRINAPLIGIALGLIKSGKKAIIRGRDIGAQLSALVRRSKATTISDLLIYVADWKAVKVQQALAAKKPEAAVQAIEDQADTLTAIAEECREVAEVLSTLAELFRDDRMGVTLSTVHKAKGLEAGTVWIAGPELLPAPWAKSEAEKEQEKHISYVAVTRAMSRLIRVNLPDRRKVQ